MESKLRLDSPQSILQVIVQRMYVSVYLVFLSQCNVLEPWESQSPSRSKGSASANGHVQWVKVITLATVTHSFSSVKVVRNIGAVQELLLQYHNTISLVKQSSGLKHRTSVC